MDHKELTEILNRDSKFENLSIFKTEEENGKFLCTLREETTLSKNGFYVYTSRDAETRELALEGAVLHMLSTGSRSDISIVSIIPEKKVREPKKKKAKEEITQDEAGESSI